MIKKVFITLIFIFATVTFSYAKTHQVALFSPLGSSPFWTLVANLAGEAANDLGIEFRLYDAELNHFKMIEQVREAVTGPNKVDAVVFPNFKRSGLPILKIAEEAKIPTFLFNSPIGAEQDAGKPREKFKYWIGEMLPDDTGATMSLANVLIEEAKRKGKVASDGKVHIVGIGGIISDSASIVRVNGFKKAMRNRTDVVLHQVVATDWGPEKGKQKFLGLIKRYPQTTAVWSASYRITDGIVEGMYEIGLRPGKDVMVNTLILNEDVLKAIKSGQLAATAGGHYIEGAWVMVLLYDYFHGIDFAQESLRMKTPMEIVTKENVDFYIGKLTKEKLSKTNLKRIDFTRFSKKFNLGLKKYNFSLEAVLSQL